MIIYNRHDILTTYVPYATVGIESAVPPPELSCFSFETFQNRRRNRDPLPLGVDSAKDEFRARDTSWCSVNNNKTGPNAFNLYQTYLELFRSDSSVALLGSDTIYSTISSNYR